MPRPIALLFVLALLLWSQAIAQNGPEIPDGYLVKPIPVTWVPPATPSSRLALEDVLPPARPPLDIPSFVGQFGAPQRYIVPKRKLLRGYSGQLIYALPSGHTVVLHVGQPPQQSIGAIAVRDKNGQEIRLIK
ncbi:hypothetical protein [Lysobacter terrae]